jgi:hypothetical protein
MEDLIMHAHILYDDNAVHHSPPLPATPAGEPVPEIYYGSKKTHVTTVPPSSPPNRAETVSPQDFTPRLPTRPANSIHPSARANPPPSPSKERGHVPPPPIPLRPSTETETPSSPARSTTTLETETSFRTSVDLESISEASQPPSARQSVQLLPVSPHPPLATLPER